MQLRAERGSQPACRRHIVAGQTNSKHVLSFSDQAISACVYENVENLVVDGIVVNLSTHTIWHEGVVNAPIQPWRSTTMTGGKILKAERIAVLKVEEVENLGGVMQRGWSWFGDIFKGLPRGIPLYVSSIDTIGSVDEDAKVFTRERAVAQEVRRYDLKLKLWWSPGKTDAFIHNEHPFLETHTQIYGLGRMQKFRERKADAVYEDVIMSPGFTHEAFCLVTGTDEFKYPWHRYYADTDAFWIAIELHPQTASQ
jgi:hypothetical protein